MNLRRTAALVLAVLMSVSFLSPASAERETPAKREAVTVAAPTYPYSPAEARQIWNASHHDKIDTVQAVPLADYLNGVVLNRIAAYVRAVTIAYAQAVHNATSIPNEARWDRVAACESGGNWSINTGNGYSGGLQFLTSTWHAVGGSGEPWQNSKAEQIRRAEILKARAGLGQWPVCGQRW